MPDHRIVLTYDPDGTLVDRVRAALPHRSLEIVRELSADAVPSAMPGTTIFFGNYLSPSALRQAGALRWIQTVGAGVDVLLSVDLAATDIVVTNTSGAFGAQIAEHALSLMFALARRLPGALRSQAARRYAPEPRDDLFELAGKTIGIVGFGDVGQALARRARGIGMRVIAMRRRPRGSPAAHPLIPESAARPARRLGPRRSVGTRGRGRWTRPAGRLAARLRRGGERRAVDARNGAPLRPGTVRAHAADRVLHQRGARRDGGPGRPYRRAARRRHRRPPAWMSPRPSRCRRILPCGRCPT